MDDDAAQLRERVEQLKQTVAKQQETIEELEQQSLLGQWDRRGVLGSIAVALGLASASGSAAAGVGDVGTSSERVDVLADQGDFNAIDADKNTVNQSFAVGQGQRYTELQKFAGTTTVQGDNTATTILPTSQTAHLFGLVIVMGDKVGSGVSYTDVLLVTRSENINAELDLTAVGAAGPRSYSLNGDDVQVAIDDTGAEYNVVAKIVGGDA